MPSLLPLPITSAITNRRLFGTDDDQACERTTAWAAAAARAGVDVIQVRERGLDDARLIALVRDVLAATAGTACRVIVNDRLDVAIATGAAGAHLPAAGIPAPRARRLAPPGFLIGLSVHASAEAAAAEREGGCDYLTFGTVFDSASKPSHHRAAGLDALADACASVTLPVLAIGGITVERADAVARAGAAGVAAIGLFAAPWTGRSQDEAARHLGAVVTALRAAFARGRINPNRSPHGDA